MSKFSWILSIDSHLRLYIALAAGAVTFFILRDIERASLHWMAAWLAFSGTFLSLSLATILACHPKDLSDLAAKQDSGRTLTMILVLTAAIVSLVAIVLLYSTSTKLSGGELALHIMLTIFSALFSWFLVHTAFAFKYANLYYALSRKQNGESPNTGLDFPEENTPDYLDFCYLAFVIGTTFQVSDVDITSKKIRRIALVHGLLSFFFNTIVLALSINIISGLMKA